MQETSNNLKWSRFNFIIENNKGFFLYNSYSNCLLNLSPEINALCCRLRDGLCHYEDFLSDEEYKYFRDNYILVAMTKKVIILDFKKHESISIYS